ncbi:mycothiol transferase [Jatrophihabitans sp.]|uniref:mycothiol transferase n=1 Tax=Jatrophihabitans sp. TaxID=1932789 RepID=UPI002BB68134|nr:DinB family protein [Jatrophihabitans sp.]
MDDTDAVAGLLADGFDRIRQLVEDTVADLSPEQLAYAPAPGANPIGWLVWHLTRIQDDHVAGLAGREQAWTAEGWYERFALPFDSSATGYGQRPEQVAAVRVPAELLLGYHRAVFSRTRDYVAGLAGPDLARVVDESWDPPVTVGVRLVSVLSDDLQHAGQAGYLTGLLSRQQA